MSDQSEKQELVEKTTRIVEAYVSHNQVEMKELPFLINDVHAALGKIAQDIPTQERAAQKPAVPINKSIMPDYIICLEDGKEFKSLKRHLRTQYQLSPEEYREKWKLPHDYPMVAPNYARARSELAKKMGLGTRRER